MKKRNNIFSLVFILANIIAVVIVGIVSFHGQYQVKFSDIFNIWLKNYKYSLIALVLALLAIFFESLKNFTTLIRLVKLKFFKLYKLALKVTILGKYYDNITPLASGSQPMQMYYYNKGDIPQGISTSLPIVSFFFAQLAFVSVSLFVFITNNSVTDVIILKISAYIGAFLAILVPILLILFSLTPKFLTKIIKSLLRFLYVIKLVKDPSKIFLKIERLLLKYRNSLKDILSKKSLIFFQIFFSFLYQISLASIPYFVLKASGVNPSYFEIFSLVMFVYAAISFIPTPGNSGAAEVSFGILFTALSNELTFYAMTFWRFSSYYLFILIGLVIVIKESFKNKKNLKIVNK